MTIAGSLVTTCNNCGQVVKPAVRVEKTYRDSWAAGLTDWGFAGGDPGIRVQEI